MRTEPSVTATGGALPGEISTADVVRRSRVTRLVRIADRSPRPAAAAGPFRSGVVAMLPVLVGLSPYGFVVGVTAGESGLPDVLGWATSPLLYGASAQLATIRLLDGGAAAGVVILTVVAINARLIAYGAALAPHWSGASGWWKAAASYFIVDPAYALATERYATPASPLDKRRYYLGVAVSMWVGWQAISAVGVVAGAGLPEGLSLEFAAPLCLIAIVVPAAKDTMSRRIAALAAAGSIVAVSMPLHLGPLVAACAAIAVNVGRRGVDR